MVNKSYTPFLKLKVNEVSGYYQLSDHIKDAIRPFFDLPMKKGLDSTSFPDMAEKSARKLKRYVGDRAFFIDNIDIPDSVLVGGADSYAYVLDLFSKSNVIPVLGLDRSPGHNAAVFRAKKNGDLPSDLVALRILPDEFVDFELVEDELKDLLAEGGGLFGGWILILDCRVCCGQDEKKLSETLSSFIKKAHASIGFDDYVVTGSSLPASISEIVKAGKELTQRRVELVAFRLFAKSMEMRVNFGDYTVVSPLYSDVDMPPEMLLNVTTPKVIYSHEIFHAIKRGGALKTHPRGNRQYNDFASDVVGAPYYRGENYSFGDKWLKERSVFGGKNVTPGTVLGPTINAHITFMASEEPFFR